MGSESSSGILDEINELIDVVRRRALDWWWLEQGSYPVTSVTVFEEGEGGLTRYLSPKISLSVALSRLRENLSLADRVDLDSKIEILSTTLGDFQRVLKVTERIMEIQRFLEENSDLISSLSQMGEAKDILERVHSKIEDIKMNLDKGDADWDSHFQDLKRVMEEARIALSKMPKLVVEKKTDEKIEKPVEKTEEKEELIEEV